jgi:hypothetical protein
MAKDKNLGKLKSRFEVQGGIVNEFDFHRNQEALAEEERNRFARREDEQALREAEAGAEHQQPQTEAERIAQMMIDAREKAEKNLKKKEKRDGEAASTTARKNAGAGKKIGGKGSKVAARVGGTRKSAAAKEVGSANKATVKKTAAKTVKKAAAKKTARPGKVSAKKSGAKSAAKKASGKKGAAQKRAGRGR